MTHRAASLSPPSPLSVTIAVASTLMLASVVAFARGPRLYIELADVKEAKHSPCRLAEAARGAMKQALGAYPAVTTQLVGKANEPKAKPTPQQRAALLASRKLKGYAVVLRITKCKHELQPPPKGQTYKLLMVEVSTAIDAEKIPSGQIALAGEGSANVGTQVSRIMPRELATLRKEALTASIKQSVKKMIERLTRPQRVKRRRRRRRRR